jgi:hypothetical protein
MKEGDLVICVNNNYFTSILTEGKKYKVLAMPSSESFTLKKDSDVINIINDMGGNSCFNISRFELDVQSMRDNAINSILN